MNSIIYYFTGTGNSLAAARQIAGILGDTTLIPIARETGTQPSIPPVERVGIIAPVYDMGLPLIVKDFAGRLDLKKVEFTFGIVTMAGMGSSALRQLDKILRIKNKKGLDAAFSVRMPGNFPPLFHPPEGLKREEILKSAHKEIAEIGEKILKQEKNGAPSALAASFLKMMTYGSFESGAAKHDESFTVKNSCTSCGICATVCPVRNIIISDGKPVWQHRCQLCLACLHFCPVEAIDLNVLFGTEKRGRYRHPDLTIEDMRIQAGIHE